MTEIAVRELGRTIAYSFEDLLKYHGPGSPGGVAHAFKVMERAFGLLSPDEPPQRPRARALRLRRELRRRVGHAAVRRDGFVPPEFLDLARKDGRSEQEDARLDVLKSEMAERVMGADAADVYDVDNA